MPAEPSKPTPHHAPHQPPHQPPHLSPHQPPLQPPHQPPHQPPRQPPQRPPSEPPLPPTRLPPIPAGADRLVLIGGTFDPPHLAHTLLASRARDAAAGPGAWLVFVPAARSPFKPDPSTPAADRLAMLRLAVAPLERACIWTDELDRAPRAPEPSYWIDTLRRAAAACPNPADSPTRAAPRLWFILGADQAAEFHRWREPREILALADPIVLLRSPTSTREALAASLRATGAWSEPEVARWLAAVADAGLMPASATEARDALRRAQRDPQSNLQLLQRLIAPAVLDYIREHHLYTEAPD